MLGESRRWVLERQLQAQSRLIARLIDAAGGEIVVPGAQVLMEPLIEREILCEHDPLADSLRYSVAKPHVYS